MSNQKENRYGIEAKEDGETVFSASATVSKQTAEEFLNEAKFSHLEHEDHGVAVTYPVVRIPDAKKYAEAHTKQRLTTAKEKVGEIYTGHTSEEISKAKQETKEIAINKIEEELQ